MGGVGKTTLTKVLSSGSRSHYSGSCFLSDVKGKTHLLHLHSKFFKSLIGSDALIGIIDEGTERLKTSLTSSYALLILDDPYQVNKFDAF